MEKCFKTVRVLLTVEKTAFLFAVDSIVGGVEIQDDFFWSRLAMRRNKGIDRYGAERPQ